MISPIAWMAEPGLDLAAWLRHGQRLGSIGRGSSWWIGDWINYGNTRFGEKYSRAARVTGYDVQSLMNMAYVASRFEVSRRREKLSWSHHAELAALPPEDQDRWLAFAEASGTSVRGLREELRTWRAQATQEPDGSEGGDVDDAADAPATCPQCGYDLTLPNHGADAAARRHDEPVSS
jgi:hypothetical protein